MWVSALSLSIIETESVSTLANGDDDTAAVFDTDETVAFGAGPQTTLRQAVQCTGIGLHCGRPVTLRLVPAAANTGIRFVRRDLVAAGIALPAATVAASWDRVSETVLCTTIANDDGASVATIEHLMAALAAAGVDNALVELDAPEPPAMDGSAAPYQFLIECAGVVALAQYRSLLRIVRPVRVEDGPKFAELQPAATAELDVEILFEHALIGRQRVQMNLTGARFKTELARARTFGFRHEVEYMQSRGLARGGSLDNAVVIDGDSIMNPDGLRFADEFARHKALDAVGDLYLAGGPILGRYVGHQPGHKLNNELLRALFADESAYVWLRGDEADTPARMARR